jgi:hypothetical protein
MLDASTGVAGTAVVCGVMFVVGRVFVEGGR